MLRVGFYTGNVYSQADYDNNLIKECCIVANPCMTKTRSIADAKKKAEYKKILNCGNCHQCEASKN